jgi:ADP-ribose pyrophosphatase YjhB (NUDIX family)
VTAHCRRCGGALVAARPATCPACGAEDWGNAKPCAAALVVTEGRVLLTRRALAPWRGLWCAPSGFCDGPEHPILAAEREVREETGVQARVVGYLGTWVTPYADEGEEADEYVSVQYYTAVPTAGLALEAHPAEVSELAWFPLDAVPAGLAPAAVLPAALAALRAALRGPGLETALPDRPLASPG